MVEVVKRESVPCELSNVMPPLQHLLYYPLRIGDRNSAIFLILDQEPKQLLCRHMASGFRILGKRLFNLSRRLRFADPESPCKAHTEPITPHSLQITLYLETNSSLRLSQFRALSLFYFITGKTCPFELLLSLFLSLSITRFRYSQFSGFKKVKRTERQKNQYKKTKKSLKNDSLTGSRVFNEQKIPTPFPLSFSALLLHLPAFFYSHSYYPGYAILDVNKKKKKKKMKQKEDTIFRCLVITPLFHLKLYSIIFIIHYVLSSAVSINIGRLGPIVGKKKNSLSRYSVFDQWTPQPNYWGPGGAYRSDIAHCIIIHM